MCHLNKLNLNRKWEICVFSIALHLKSNFDLKGCKAEFKMHLRVKGGK